MGSNPATPTIKTITYETNKLPENILGSIWVHSFIHDFCKKIVYLVHLITRKSSCEMILKLSVIESRKFSQSIGIFSLRNLISASANCLHVLSHLLCVIFLCITPHNRSIGFKCGQYGGIKCNLMRRPG